jgi:hypothetical protein
VFKFHKKYIAEHLPMPVWYDNTDALDWCKRETPSCFMYATAKNNKSYVEISLTSKIR